MNDILWLTMRRLRRPLILMIIVYFLSVFGLLLIPGEDASGEPFRVGFLDAAYFVAILATTIGFGEMPVTFTHAQRLYAFIIVYPNVVVWLYSIGTIISLLVDPQFRAVRQRSRFRRGARRIGGDYFIVCGFGNTGRMIVRALLRRRIGAVILERETEHIHGMELDDDFAHLPGLAGDVTDRRLLEIAGLANGNPGCRGVLAITNDDHANLTVAITSKLLRPDLPVLARSENPRVSANMASFGTELAVNPYAIFAERLRLALDSPVKYLVQDWLISVPGTQLREPLEPPRGPW
ncbi:MAG: NAD-binding protein, partial [Xanthomonadales bacterium]|nr:NAD-binding protein [Xanthomonadales bacterium]